MLDKAIEMFIKTKVPAMPESPKALLIINAKRIFAIGPAKQILASSISFAFPNLCPNL